MTLRIFFTLVLFCLGGITHYALAQTPVIGKPETSKTEGTLVYLRAEAETWVNNDEARVNFFVQEQSADRAQAASTSNRKIKETIERIRHMDPSAEIRTTGFHTYPQYDNAGRIITSWQVRQEISVTTRNLTGLEKLIARTQEVANVGGIVFGLSRPTQKKVQAELFGQAFNDLRTRIGNVAQALGKNDNDVDIEEINLLEATPAITPRAESLMVRAASAEVAPGKLEASDSRQALSFTARIRVRR